jgi:hypothetical protein
MAFAWQISCIYLLERDPQEITNSDQVARLLHVE